MNQLGRILESLIFASRWLQAPLYLGLIVAQGVYVYLFMVELSHLVHNAFSEKHLSETDVMLVVLGLIAFLQAEKPPMCHVVLTGRNAKDELIEIADLVTEMELIKHPFRSGIKAQPGVEF